MKPIHFSRRLRSRYDRMSVSEDTWSFAIAVFCEFVAIEDGGQIAFGSDLILVTKTCHRCKVCFPERLMLKVKATILKKRREGFVYVHSSFKVSKAVKLASKPQKRSTQRTPRYLRLRPSNVFPRPPSKTNPLSSKCPRRVALRPPASALTYAYPHPQSPQKQFHMTFHSG